MCGIGLIAVINGPKKERLKQFDIVSQLGSLDTFSDKYIKT